MITDQQLAFFETFGYLHFPGLMRDSIYWITDEFTAVFTDRGIVHDPSKRTCIVPFIDQREKFCTLLDDPRIVDIANKLLGEDFNYLGGDGNYYTGNTGWHSDGYHNDGLYIKVAMYLDPVTKETGALRVIPGSHKVVYQNWEARKAGQSETLWGISGDQVPAVALESTPGDVVVFNHNLMHAAYGGSHMRRMFTLNLARHARSEAEVQELEQFVNSGARFWITQTHGEKMLDTASPARMRHLAQVIEHEHALPALVEECKKTMLEPARG